MVCNRKIFIIFFVLSFIWILSLVFGIFVEDKIHISKDIIFSDNAVLSFPRILMNNTRMIMCCLLGFIFACIPTIICIVLNGFVLGVFCTISYAKTNSLSFILSHTMPHSLEIIALLTASTIGVIIFSILIKTKNLKEIKRHLLIGFSICEIEILIAALVEYYVELT